MMTQTKTNVWIHGINGKMGQCLKNSIQKSHDFKLIENLEKHQTHDLQQSLNEVDLIIDFSSKEGNEALYQVITSQEPRDLKVVICTTGLEANQLKAWEKLGESLTILEAPNTSLGIFTLNKIAREVSGVLRANGFDIEVEETHHRYKTDAPSGTALYLAQNLAQTTQQTIQPHGQITRKEDEIGIHASRGGGVFGEHKIRFLGDFEELTLSHRAFSRELFAKGALTLSRWLKGQKKGFYQLNQVSITSLSDCS